MRLDSLFVLVVGAILVVLVQNCAAGKEEVDYYAILGVSRDASAQQIKKAFRDLSRKFHPDKAPGDKEIERKYMDIQQAYDVLSDDDKRRKYDQFGVEGLKEGGGGGGGFGFGGSPFDFFNFGFGGGHSHGGQEMEKGETTTIPLEVTLEDVYLGRTLKVAHKKQTLCHKCRGTGAKDPKDVKICTGCKGSGMKVKVQQGHGFIQQFQTVCDECGGKGKVVKSTCPHCSGSKVETAEEFLTIIVEKGMPDGHSIVFEQEGPEKPEVIPGDVVFKIVTERHQYFTRKGNDLYYHMSISLLEALIGFEKEITHLDGHTVKIARKEVTPPGYVLTISEEGMPVHTYPSQYGNLFVDFSIRFPATITAEQKSALKDILK